MTRLRIVGFDGESGMNILTPIAPIHLVGFAPSCCRDCPSRKRIGEGIRALWLIGEMSPEDIEDMAEQACAGCAKQRAQADFRPCTIEQDGVVTYIWVRMYPDGDHLGPITHEL